MTHSIPVQCLINRSWNIASQKWDGETVNGTLIDISTQTDENLSGKSVSVGIVILTTGAFHSIPVEFITQI